MPKPEDPLDPRSAMSLMLCPENVLNHVLLPRFIPPDANFDYGQQEANILIRMNEAARSLADCLPSGTVAMFASFVHVQQMHSVESIRDGVLGLLPGQTFAMYVRSQNTVFMCHMPANASTDAKPNGTTPVIVATFPGRIGVRHVYSHPSDLEVSWTNMALIEYILGGNCECHS